MMEYPFSPQLHFPVEPYQVSGYKFGERIRGRFFLTAKHLGDDVLASSGTPVRAIGEGNVVWSEIRPGSEAKRNWGGIVVLAHQHKKSQFPMTNDQSNPNDQIPIPGMFYSVYGHLKNLRFKKGDQVQQGNTLGEVAEALTPENGWWKQAHLHFAIYVGPWSGEILPGWHRWWEGRTKIEWWRDPRKFLEEYNTQINDQTPMTNDQSRQRRGSPQRAASPKP